MNRITDTVMPYKTIIRLSGVARNPANGFPARPLGVLKGRGVAAEAVQLRGFKDAAAYAEAGNEPLADLAAARADVLDLAAAHEAGGAPWRTSPIRCVGWWTKLIRIHRWCGWSWTT